MVMRKVLLIGISVLSVASLTACEQIRSASGGTKVACTFAPLDHPSLGAAIRGFQRGLKEGDKTKSYRVKEYNAAGDPQLTAPLLEQTVADGCDVVFVVTTSAAQAARRLVAEKGVPVIFTAVTDPVGAKIVSSPDGTETVPITGFTDRYPTDRQVELFLQIAPQTRSAAILFNPTEQNSAILVGETEKLLIARGIKVAKFGVSDKSQAYSAARSAAQAADILIVNGDNLFTENLESVIRAGREQGKPLFVGDPDSVRRGAVATVGPNYDDLGYRSGVRAATVLGGQNAGTLAIEDPKQFDVVINVRAAKDFKLSIPPSVFDRPAVWTTQE